MVPTQAGNTNVIHRLRLTTTSRVAARRYVRMANHLGINPVRIQMVAREIMNTPAKRTAHTLLI